MSSKSKTIKKAEHEELNSCAGRNVNNDDPNRAGNNSLSASDHDVLNTSDVSGTQNITVDGETHSNLDAAQKVFEDRINTPENYPGMSSESSPKQEKTNSSGVPDVSGTSNIMNVAANKTDDSQIGSSGMHSNLAVAQKVFEDRINTPENYPGMSSESSTGQDNANSTGVSDVSGANNIINVSTNTIDNTQFGSSGMHSNLAVAQREYEDKMNRPVNYNNGDRSEISHSSEDQVKFVSGGQSFGVLQYFGTNQASNNLANDVGTSGKLIYTRGIRAQVSRLEFGALKTGVMAAGLTLAMNGAEGGKGLRQVYESSTIAYEVAGAPSIGLVTSALNIPLKAQLNDMIYSFQRANPSMRIGSAQDMVRALNGNLVRMGQKPIPNAVGTQLQIYAGRQLRRARIAGMPKSVINTYKELHKIGKLTAFQKPRLVKRASKKVIRLNMFLSRQFKKYGDLGGQGLAITSRVVTLTTKAIKTTIRFTRGSLRLARIAAKTAANASAKLALFAARKAMSASISAAATMGATGVASALGSINSAGGAVLNKASRTNRKINNGINRLRTRKNALMERIRDPFRIKSKFRNARRKLMRKTWNALTNKFKFLKVFANAFNKVANVIATIKVAVATLFQTIGLILFGLIIFACVASIIAAITGGLFDFSTQTKDMQKVAVNAVKDAYMEDLNYLMDLNDTYTDGVTLSYENIKDDKVYENYKNEEQSATFVQTSNCAEILSMATVRFGYDLESDGTDDGASKKDLKEYVQGLYHGSHEIQVTENVWTESYEDSNGDVITTEHKSADIVYRTYFFNSIFERKLAKSTPRVFVQDMTSTGDVENEDQAYYWLRENGFSHAGACGIMGNAKIESDWNVNCQTGSYWGLFQLNNKGTHGDIRGIKCVEYCKQKGIDSNSKSGHLAYMLAELNGTISNSISGIPNRPMLFAYLKSTDNAKQAAKEFCVGYERCVGGSDAYTGGVVYPGREGKLYQALNKRVSAAESYASKYSKYKDDWSALAPASGDLVEYAKSWVGKIKYVYGGSGRGRTLEDCAKYGLGTDCSGFVHSVFKHFGVNTPTISHSFAQSSKKVPTSDVQPGDVVVWESHVGIYIGDGKLVHAANPSSGVKISTVASQQGHCGRFLGYYRYYVPKPEVEKQSESESSGGISSALISKLDMQDKYSDKLIHDSGCVPTSMGNVARTYLGIDISTKKANSVIREACNDYVRGLGVGSALNSMKGKWGYTFTKTDSFDKMLAHVKKGKMGLISVNAKPFCSGGGKTHCMTIVGHKGDKLAIWDSYWSAHKNWYKQWGIENNGNGMIYVTENQLKGKTKGYYPISKK